MLARHRAAIGGAVAVCLALGVTGAWAAQCPNLTQLCAPRPGAIRASSTRTKPFLVIVPAVRTISVVGDW